MTKKIVAITLTILFILPATCFAEDVEIGDIKLKWKKGSRTIHSLMAQIPITSNTRTRYSVKGKFLFYDKDGFELCKIPFWENMKGQESKVLHVSGLVTDWDYDQTTSFMVIIETKPSGWRGVGKKPLILERELKLPPWNGHEE